MKFTEFIKDYVKKHPGVKYKDAIKDKKVRCLWHDHRGKEIGCPSSCPPVPQEKLQLNTLPRPASYEPQQPIRTNLPVPPPERRNDVGGQRNNSTRLMTIRDADGRVEQNQTFLSGLLPVNIFSTLNTSLGNALESIRQAIPEERPILAPTDDQISTPGSTPGLTLATGYRDEEEFIEENPQTRPVQGRVPQLVQIYEPQTVVTQRTAQQVANNLPRQMTEQELRDEGFIEESDDEMPAGEPIEEAQEMTPLQRRHYNLGAEKMDEFKFDIERRMTGTRAEIASKSSSYFNTIINRVPDEYKEIFINGLNSGGDRGRLYKIKYDRGSGRYIYGSGLSKKKSRKYI